ncbi:TolC family protein [Fulvivirgaceae bacterium BMA10]|uniref:TolC family protein n=1 Tax=Splendidivirga corallicola TaxID=3051826 RepID=A0ABT8KX32_9BACT|nr:TolC family protein [Fulvivirgaceae bacterium BMA10]
MFKKYIATVIGFLCMVPSFCQEKLSLSDAIQLGLKNNYDVQIERENVDIASNNNNIGEAGLLPRLSLNVNQNNSLTDNVKTATPFQTQGETIANSLSPTLSLNWTLFDGFRARTTSHRLAKLQEETQGNASIVIANTIQSTILGYYVAVLELERLRLFERNMKLSKDKYEYLKIKKELGSAVSTELLLEENNYLTDSTSYINQQLQYRNAIRNLNILLAVKDQDTDYELTDSLAFAVVDYQYDDLHAKMTNENVDLKKQYLTQSLLNYDTRISRADLYPNLSLSTGYTDGRTRIDLSNASFPSSEGPTPGPADPLTTRTTTLFANFTLSFNLFNGGKVKRAIRNAMIREDIGNLRIEKLKESLNKDLLSALDEYNTRRLLDGINERKVRAAQLNLEISQEKFKSGTINSFDYRTVQNNYLSAAFEKLQSVYNLIDSNVSLMRLTGGIIKEHQNEE